jgi:uncharacterized protein YaaQ
MKLIIVTLPDVDQTVVTRALVAEDLRVTRLASTGTLLRSGTSTLLIGVTDDFLEQAIQIIQANITPALDPGLKKVSLFVLNVEKFRQI